MTKNFLNSLQEKVNEPTIKSGFKLSEYTSNALESVKKTYLDFSFKNVFSVGTSEETQFDTYHYFLIPDIENPDTFIVNVHRVVPVGVIDESKIKKRKIFHIADESHFEKIKQEVVSQIKDEKIKSSENDISFYSESSNILKTFSHSIDQSSMMASNGLFLLGVGTLMLNPVTGIAIIASSFMPDFLTTGVSASFKSMSQKLSNKSNESRNSNAEKKAIEELKKINPVINYNSTLKRFYNCLIDSEYSALLEIDDEKDKKDFQLTSEILKTLFHDTVNKKDSLFQKNQTPNNVKNFINSL